MKYQINISILVLFSFLLMCHPSFSQKDIRKADKQLELKAYDLAIKNYKIFLDENPENTYAQLKLADAYRQVNDLMKAIYWYERAISTVDIEPIHQLNYAHSLKKLGLYEKAKLWYGNYSASDANLSADYLSGCDRAIELLKEVDKYELIPFDGNSTKSDFGAALFGNKIVFSSFRKDLPRNSDKQNLSYIQNVGNQLYIAPNELKIEESKLKFLRPEIKEINGIGPVSYSEDLKSIAYTKNNLSDGAISVEATESDLSIYLGTVTESGDFTNEYPLAYNSVEFAYAFPHLAFNGSALYFASNQPGGFGGFDIYVSYFKDKKWTKPENLGEQLNGKYNEITPFLDANELYFSSDEPSGLGGYDVFKSEVSNGKWSGPINMGKGINSPADDYYMVKDKQGNFYITSNRLGGKGKDDIYIASEISSKDEMLALNVPKAIELDELVTLKEEPISPNAEMPLENKSPRNVSLEESVLKEAPSTTSASELDIFAESNVFKLYDHFELSLEGAKKIGAREPFDPNVKKYFIQIASLSRSKGVIADFNNIKQLGNLYRFIMSNSTKIRLGSFDSKIDADMMLDKVKSRGYSDAFITSAVLSDANYELINEGEFVNYYGADDSNIGEQYKVRLASYSDPLWFNTSELKYLDGELEQWTKGYWTIFVLSGFDSIEEAEAARIKAVNRGFKEAEVVIDDRGVLKKIQQH